MEKLVKLFRRETLSTEFIPVIDGLRFLAIAMVVLFHCSPTTRYPGENYLPFGHQGVQLFFVISGFVLAMPFLRFGLGLTQKKMPLKKYFLRRITRLEPPYIISIGLIFLLLAIFSRDKLPLSDLLASLGCSYLYINNFVFPGKLPLINRVTWSLEIEVQYYLIAPFIVGSFCLLKSKITRRMLMLASIFIFGVISWWMETVEQFPLLSLPRYLQYFLAGVLLCEIYLLDRDALAKLNNIFIFALGLVLLIVLVGVEHSISANFGLKVGSPFMILAFYLIVFGNGWWHRVFSLRPVTLIGGMCYSIYLLHAQIIAGVDRGMRALLPANGFYFHYVIETVILCTAVLVLCGIFFLLIEKPCMNPNWVADLKTYIRGIAARRSSAAAEQA
jgi:peptidoglycan/LPS O-acetylase OafA/YrhL